MKTHLIRAGLGAGLVTAVVAIAAAAAGVPLTGETLAGTASTAGACTSTGTASYTFSSSGIAGGPYDGTYTESGSFVLDTSNEETTDFDADFIINAVDGTVVTGHKSTVISSNDGFCLSGSQPYGSAFATVHFTANIRLPDGTSCTDAGTSDASVDGGQDNTTESFVSDGSFSCAPAVQPAGKSPLFQKGDGCGDPHHIHAGSSNCPK